MESRNLFQDKSLRCNVTKKSVQGKSVKWVFFIFYHKLEFGMWNCDKLYFVFLFCLPVASDQPEATIILFISFVFYFFNPQAQILLKVTQQDGEVKKKKTHCLGHCRWILSFLPPWNSLYSV